MYEKYLVTGAKDPVGRLVVQMLLSEGHSVRVLVPPETDSSLLRGMGAEIYEGEIFDRDSLKDFLTVENPRQSAVIHTEEIVSISNEKNLNMRRVNVAGAENMVDMSIRAKIGRFVYLGSAYSLDPDSALDGEQVHFDRKKAEGDYAVSKAEASAYIMEKVSLNKFNASLLLPTFIIGPGFSEDYDMNKILKKYLENKVSTVSGGHAFVDVRNVATALVAVCENGVPGGSYILNGEYKSSQEFFAEVSEASGSEKVKEMPKWTQSKSMGKFVDTFYRITKKDNPKEVYALFMNSPEKDYESTVNGLIPDSEVRKVHDSLTDVLMRPGNEVLPDNMPRSAVSAGAAAAAKAIPIVPVQTAAQPAEEAPVSEPDEEKSAAGDSSEAVKSSASPASSAVEDSAKTEDDDGNLTDEERRAKAAAEAKARFQARIEAAKTRSAQAAAAAEEAAAAETESVKTEAADVDFDRIPEAQLDDEPSESAPAPERPVSSFMSGISVADMLAQAAAKREAEKAARETDAAEKNEAETASLDEADTADEAESAETEGGYADAELEISAEAEVVEPEKPEIEAAETEIEVHTTVDADSVEADVVEEPEETGTVEADIGDVSRDESSVEIETAAAVDDEAAAEDETIKDEPAIAEPSAEEPGAEAESEEPAAPAATVVDNDASKPLWERISSDDITEEEIFGDDPLF